MYVIGTPYTRVGASDGYLRSIVTAVSSDEKCLGFIVEEGASYGQNRNRIVDSFLWMPETAEWLLQIDDDITFPYDIFKRLLADPMPQDAKVVIGAVQITQDRPNIFTSTTCLAVDPYLGDEPCPVIKGFGGAVMLVHRSVYQEMAEKLGWGIWFAHSVIQKKSDDGSMTIVEVEPDLSFAQRLHALGVTVRGRTDIEITHRKETDLKRVLQKTH